MTNPSAYSSSQKSPNPIIRTPWTADETGLSLFQRLQASSAFNSVSIHLSMSRLELVHFHEQYEIAAVASEVSEVMNNFL